MEMKHGVFTTFLNPNNRHCKFDDDDEVPEVVMTLFKMQAAEFYDSGIQKLIPRLNKYLDNAGDCVKNKVMYRQFIHNAAFVN